MRGLNPQGDAVRSARKALGLTQEALALRAACDVKTIRSAEKGARIDASTLNRIADALQRPTASLLSAADVPAAQLEANIRLYWQWQAASNRRGIEGMLACYHPDATVNIAGADDLPGGGEFQGLDAIREQWTAAQEAFETDELTPDQVQVDAMADLVFARALGRARVRATGVEFTSFGVQEFLIKDDKILRHTIVVDTAAIRRSMPPEE